DRHAAAFGVSLPAAMIHEDKPHHLRRDGYEMRPSLPGSPLFSRQLQISLVDQRCRLKGVSTAFTGQKRSRQAVQFGVNFGYECVEGGPVSRLPCFEEALHIRSLQTTHKQAHHSTAEKNSDEVTIFVRVSRDNRHADEFELRNQLACPSSYGAST